MILRYTFKVGKQQKGGNLYHYDTDCIEDLMSNLRHMIDIDRAAYSNRTDFDREMKYIKEEGIGVEDVNKIVTAAVIKAEIRIQNERDGSLAVQIRNVAETKTTIGAARRSFKTKVF